MATATGPRRWSATWFSALALAWSLAPAVVSAATLVVDADGTYDSGTNACTGVNPAYTTIQSAVTAAVNTDTILVCPGTYAEAQILINKALTVQSVAGAASTIVDGLGGTGLVAAGTVYITATAGNVLFDGFTVRNAKSQANGTRFNIRVGSTAAVTITVTHNVLIGTNNPLDGVDYGLYAAGPNANDTFVFQYNRLLNHGSNTILIERHKGPTDVSYNTFTRGVRSTTISAYINMSHSGDAITTLQKVSNNTIDMANDPGPYSATNSSNAIVFQGALTGTSLGTFSNVEISGNTITNLRSFRRGIALVNNANTLANQALGLISNAVVSCNTMTWTGPPEAGSYGIRLLGYVSNPTMTNNAIDGVDVGLKVEPRNSHITNTATFEQNSVTDTGVAAVDWQPTGALSAEDNWWGSATGPTNPSNPGGTGGILLATGSVDFTPWLLSGGDADPGPCFVPGCGNGTTDPGEDCDQGTLNGDPSVCCTVACVYVAAGPTCRTAVGVCDVAETCSGNDGACPADGVAGTTVQCRSSAGACDPAENCDGVGKDCPADGYAPSGTPCRAAAGVCDLVETCDGAGLDCPADAKSTAVCRSTAGVCDVAETCDGTGNDCPSDGFASSTQECRGSAGICDVAEHCTGSGANCPADGFQLASQVCRAATGACDLTEHCTGGGASCPADAVASPTTVCRPSTGACDVLESCDGSAKTCPADGFATSGTLCDDGSFCTFDDTCDGSGACTVSTPVDCDDVNPCTDDSCDSQAGGFLCEYANNGSCVGPNCGNTVVDAGETCDPPNLTPGSNGQPQCRLDCTSCGDGVVQANNTETCDDGNLVSGCQPAHPQLALDGCLNNCSEPICADPARIKFGATDRPDLFSFHSRLISDVLVDFTNNHFVIELRDANDVVLYRSSLLSGSLEVQSVTSVRYKDSGARDRGGIYKLKTKAGKGYYVLSLKAYGDLSAAVADMRTHVYVGSDEWVVRGKWTAVSDKGWKLSNKDALLPVP